MGNGLSSESSTFSLPTTPTTIQTTEAVTGSHQMKITNYSQTERMGVGWHITSAPFSVGSCTWAIEYYPCGTEKVHESYISLGLSLCHGPGIIHALFHFTLLDWQGTIWEDAKLKFSSKVFSLGDVCIVHFLERKSLEESGYLKADSFIIHCTVTTMKYPCVPKNNIAQSITIPPCNLCEQLCRSLASGLGTDVTFRVDGKRIHAHKCVLAASSPVFKAMLFGPMKEKDKNLIQIKEIKAPIFKAMLNFIYTGKLSDTSLHGASCWMHQHLLVAADRFALERLRSTCEFLLCRDLDVDNVSTTLVLAEQYNCRQLKAACLKYIASHKILMLVMATDGFQHLISSCPWMLGEINARTSAATTSAISGRVITVLMLSLCVVWIVVMYFTLL
ncbi:BTB/POZ/MATH-domain protein [Rhynchospora pubera]|uniref:BTB/POZ/MATH-domain protein n=1 Tax=Rhynchospora pubera TaxID=906938 RepID=A0AAV8CMJ8_9POAL|nr:BTB/POZ/MATH-domain protein [Rhynchospora pubera]